jgi:hypothetical protein
MGHPGPPVEHLQTVFSDHETKRCQVVCLMNHT